MQRFGLYVHIPYCRNKCRYCDFYSLPGRHGVPDAYVDALLGCHEKLWGGVRPSSVYFGGGTPGLLSPAQVERLLRAFDARPGAEITLEANPGAVEAGQMDGWRRAGVNRLSLGVQSARDASLKTLGRLHTAQEARAALAAAREAGFDNVSADMMLALPGYSRAELDETLALIAEQGAAHISAYLLKIEPGTAFGRSEPQNLPDADAAADFYLYAVERLAQAGYRQYEISNFAQEGCEGRHNLLYWNGGDYLGLGPGAHSSLAGERFSFEKNVEAFIEGALALRPEGPFTAEDYIMLRLRLAAGLDFAQLQSRFGVALTARQTAFLAALETQGYAELRPGGVCLTARGMLVQNAILVKLLK